MQPSTLTYWYDSLRPEPLLRPPELSRWTFAFDVAEKEVKNPGPSKIPLCGEGPGIGFTPKGCPINFTTCSWNSGIVEYWSIGSNNEIVPIEMIKGFIRLMKPILFLSPSIHKFDDKFIYSGLSAE